MSEPERLVSVGIPTYNRAASLTRAVESVLAQSYANLEIVISDNASTDRTPELCRAWCDRDERVRYIRQPRNRGPVANFEEVLRHSRGEYFMWLADDDWLDPGYVEACAAVLDEKPDHVLVAGLARTFGDAGTPYQEEPLNLTAVEPAKRVRGYYWMVVTNGAFYGLMRRAAISRVPFPNVLANDWLILAALAFQGKIATLEHVALHREMSGASWQGIDQLAAGFELRGINRWNPFFDIARRTATDILWQSPVYREMSRPQRLKLALEVYRIVQLRYGIPHARKRLAARSDLPSRLAVRLLTVALR